MDLDGVVGHVVQGTKILLQCKVQAARPAANVTWKNGTHYLNENDERLEMFETKIQENVSKNGNIVIVSCNASDFNINLDNFSIIIERTFLHLYCRIIYLFIYCFLRVEN